MLNSLEPVPVIFSENNLKEKKLLLHQRVVAKYSHLIFPINFPVNVSENSSHSFQ